MKNSPYLSSLSLSGIGLISFGAKDGNPGRRIARSTFKMAESGCLWPSLCSGKRSICLQKKDVPRGWTGNINEGRVVVFLKRRMELCCWRMNSNSHKKVEVEHDERMGQQY